MLTLRRILALFFTTVLALSFLPMNGAETVTLDQAIQRALAKNFSRSRATMPPSPLPA